MNPHRQVHVCGTFRVAVLGGIREGESVGSLPQGLSRLLLLFSQESASKTENR